MLRREFFNWLGGLPFFGFLKQEEKQNIKGLKPVVGTLKTVLRPKLRIWSLYDEKNCIKPTQKDVDILLGLLSKWNGKDNLDIIWGGPISVQQLDITTNDIDMVLQPGDAKVEDIKIGDDGKMTARIVCKEPFIRVINE